MKSANFAQRELFLSASTISAISTQNRLLRVPVQILASRREIF
jgi:hypothetical protein